MSETAGSPADPSSERLDDTFLIRGSASPHSREDMLQIGAFQSRSKVAGPGDRAVVWVSGCRRRCPGCMKPDLFDFGAGRAVVVDELAQRILSVPALDGVTFSGGEPFEQALPLANLARRLRAAGLNVMVYTGYRLTAIEAESARFGCLLSITDILVDGEYRHYLPGPSEWRGSTNQVIHTPTPAGRAAVEAGRPDPAIREVQVSLTSSGLRLSGFPSGPVLRQLAQQLSKRGIEVRPCSSEDHP